MMPIFTCLPRCAILFCHGESILGIRFSTNQGDTGLLYKFLYFNKHVAQLNWTTAPVLSSMLPLRPKLCFSRVAGTLSRGVCKSCPRVVSGISVERDKSAKESEFPVNIWNQLPRDPQNQNLKYKKTVFPSEFPKNSSANYPKDITNLEPQLF